MLANVRRNDRLSVGRAESVRAGVNHRDRFFEEPNQARRPDGHGLDR